VGPFSCPVPIHVCAKPHGYCWAGTLKLQDCTLSSLDIDGLDNDGRMRGQLTELKLQNFIPTVGQRTDTIKPTVIFCNSLSPYMTLLRMIDDEAGSHIQRSDKASAATAAASYCVCLSHCLQAIYQRGWVNFTVSYTFKLFSN